MTFGCGRRKEVVAQDRFCAAARDAVGLEFTHGFPWKIYDCLTRLGVRPSVALVDQYTGIRYRKKITHRWAAWGDGARLDVRFKPSGDFSKDIQFRDYWGAYELVVWRP